MNGLNKKVKFDGRRMMLKNVKEEILEMIL